MRRNISPEKIVDLLYRGGVVGAGGGGFPTHIKYRSRAKTVIANGAECEPLLSTDKIIMVYQQERVIKGLRYAMRATGASEGVIALKKHYYAAIDALNKALKGAEDIRLHLLEDFYPAGDEFNLLYEVTGKIIPEGGLPLNVGCVVSNVGTLTNVADAVEGKPVIMREVTVTGEVMRPSVIEVPVGTPIRDIIDFVGGAKITDYVAFLGGPMMGRLAENLDEPITKTTGGVVLLPKSHPLAKKVLPEVELQRAKSCCEACRYCTDFCTRYLLGHRIEPHLMIRALGYGRDLPTEQLTSAFLCCSCGICNIHACPASLNPRALYQNIRKEFGRHRLVNPLRNQPQRVHPDRDGRRLPVARLAQRTGTTRYQRKLEREPVPFFPRQVRIKTGQPGGFIPIVKAGERVRKGQVIGYPEREKSGTISHASISGAVIQVNREQITISDT
jgi:Na+-translocating ferredoxin:NAD+ oxidoreductase RnfC subunit